MTQRARPFIKWAGGKGRLLRQIDAFFPQELKNGRIQNYVEPFLGSGAVFFAIAENYNIKNAWLSDLNRDLILTYKVIQKKAALLLDILRLYQKKYDAGTEARRHELFFDVRKQFNEQRFEINYKRFSENWLTRAAQFIFLNKTCFNGLFRLNAQGEFNVPPGKYTKAVIFDEHNILAVSDVLRNAEIVCADYSQCYPKVNDAAFAYFDPPYRPITRTSHFTAYTETEFNDNQQIELSLFFRRLDAEKGVKLMLSNSDPANTDPSDAFFEEAYSGFNIYRVSVTRAVNCNGAKRGKINELLITNY
ncbi:MAG: Dam family site-specific DNA-(adenine-N6)-methyltransferase [Treponema sp.]|jgi:DNA adenine methylase|nr:Dam family site-specific DNA-(adenine-N6)-methyltransferase [Treponema sp.]